MQNSSWKNSFFSGAIDLGDIQMGSDTDGID